MFNKKNDPLLKSVQSVMSHNDLRRELEMTLNEELGITSKKSLPHEYHEAYDLALEDSINEISIDAIQKEAPNRGVNEGKLKDFAKNLISKKKKEKEKPVDDHEGGHIRAQSETDLRKEEVSNKFTRALSFKKKN